ncbi:MAG TPA: amidophosphoribosyltransferase [Candidatus Atribacteria bacterium]|nr:amidophosphoribosyltransferase [Candidatus Atribacteria bacterium]
MREECGIFGIFNNGNGSKKDTSIDVAKLTYFGLYALQHRGQESAGIAVSDGENILVYKDLGLVSEVFNEEKLSILQGNCAVGHVRYSAKGKDLWKSSQPLINEHKGKTFVLAHNGSLMNSDELKAKITQETNLSRSTTNTEIMGSLIAERAEEDIEDAIKSVAAQLKGAFSLIIMTNKKLIGLRDRCGFRPLSLGKLKDSYLFASETSAFNLIGAEFIREVEPGEMIVIDRNGLKSFRILPSRKGAFCVFEFVYLARPDSDIYGENVAFSRQKMGQRLAQEHPVEADLVMPVPDSGRYTAIGYAYQSGIPYGEGLLRNHYIGRTFIQPVQSIREGSVKIKLSPIKKILEGKRVILVDDSIVRGTTSKKLIKLLKEAGAREVHLRISSPPVMWPCFYGIDTPNKKDLWAANHSLEETRKWLGADSLGHVSIKGLCSIFDKIPADNFCLACFDGKYPI